MNSPTQLSLKWYRDRGYIAEVVEKWIPAVKRRRDLFKFIDVIAAKPGEGIVGCQTTVSGELSKRRSKIESLPASRKWLRSGGRIHLHGWKKRVSNRGKLWFVDARELKL